MDSSNGATHPECQSLAKKLRLELKEWEQSFTATHRGRKAGRQDIKQHPEIGQKHSLTALQNHLLILTKHTSTNSMTDCGVLLRANQLLRTLHPRRNALLPLPVLFLHPPLQISVRSTLVLTSLQQLLPTIERHPNTRLLEPSIHLLDLHLRRMAKCLGFLIKFLQLPSHRRLQSEKHFNR